MAKKTPASNKCNSLLKLISMILLLDIVLTGVVFYIISHRKDPLFYAVLSINNQQRAVPLTQYAVNPIINNDIVLNWATLATTRAYTYDAANYLSQLPQVVTLYFTKQGSKNFAEALVNTGTIDNIVNKQMSLTSIVTGQPVILKQGILWGEYSYKIQFPLVLTYELAGSQPINIKTLITLLIIKAPTSELYQGLGIQQFWTKKLS